jgi:hypothetical protein
MTNFEMKWYFHETPRSMNGLPDWKYEMNVYILANDNEDPDDFYYDSNEKAKNWLRQIKSILEDSKIEGCFYNNSDIHVDTEEGMRTIMFSKISVVFQKYVSEKFEYKNLGTSYNFYFKKNMSENDIEYFISELKSNAANMFEGKRVKSFKDFYKD